MDGEWLALARPVVKKTCDGPSVRLRSAVTVAEIAGRMFGTSSYNVDFRCFFFVDQCDVLRHIFRIEGGAKRLLS